LVNWKAFATAAPELAAHFERQLAETQLCLLGTNTVSGWPRISPCEAYIADGDLMFGMMWRSRKALDLLRDSRLTVTTAQCDREAANGDVKLYGYGVPVEDAARKNALADAQEKVINWRPSEPFHAFALDVRRASYIAFGEKRRMVRWSVEGGGVEVLRHPDERGGAG
jgi:pyridoxamine 5'-phosphate oxidase-like protein